MPGFETPAIESGSPVLHFPIPELSKKPEGLKAPGPGSTMLQKRVQCTGINPEILLRIVGHLLFLQHLCEIVNACVRALRVIDSGPSIFSPKIAEATLVVGTNRLSR